MCAVWVTGVWVCGVSACVGVSVVSVMKFFEVDVSTAVFMFCYSGVLEGVAINTRYQEIALVGKGVADGRYDDVG